MTGRSDTERFLDAFLAPEADQLSDRVLQAALSDIARTPQRRALRVPWRFTNMPVFARAAAAALAFVVLVGAGGIVYLSSGGLTGGPNPTASPSPTAHPSPSTASASPPPLAEGFTSTIHGISIDYPSGWQTRPATEPWTGGQLSFDSRAADVIFDPARGGLLYLTLASQPYGPLSQDAWRDGIITACLSGDSGGSGGSWRVDGARAFVHGCGTGEIQVLVFTDTRGYFIRLVAPPTDLVEVYDWDWLKQVLQTADLRPELPVDAPSRSMSP
jgi:hypothetical protein